MIKTELKGWHGKWQSIAADGDKLVFSQCRAENVAMVMRQCFNIMLQDLLIKHIEKNILHTVFKKYILSQSLFSEKTDAEHCRDCCDWLPITIKYAHVLYDEIPQSELAERNVGLVNYLSSVKESCAHCNNVIYNVHKNTIRKWKGEIICDTCWCKTEPERYISWEKIKKYKPHVCTICTSIQYNPEERYQYDHKNMFDNDDTICNMVYTGRSEEDINMQLDKCQSVCISCHHLITKCENRTTFTRIKGNLTRQYNSCIISEYEYNVEISKQKTLYGRYIDKMYDTMRKAFL